MALAIAIFAVALAVVASDKVHRTKVALIGASLVVLTGVLEQDEAIASIDFNTIGLLAGMMLIVRVTEPTGVYNYLAIRAGQLSRGKPALVVLSLALTTAVLSAFLDNLTTVLLVVPITFLLADALDIDPIPLVIIVVTGALYLFYRRKLQIRPEARARIMEIDARRSIEDMAELKRTMPILGLTIFAFFLHNALHLEPATVALTGAAAMHVVTRQSVEEALAGIEWATLFFFLGLFVLVGGLEQTGAIDEVADGIASLTDGDRTAELMGILGFSALGSAIVDNIPFTAAMLPVVEQLQSGNAGDNAYWWSLSLGACFGGNATLIAAAANVAAAGMAERSGRRIGFVEFLRVGVPATLLSLAIACAYVLLRYVA